MLQMQVTINNKINNSELSYLLDNYLVIIISILTYFSIPFYILTYHIVMPYI